MLWSVANQRKKMLNRQVVRAVALLLPLNQEDPQEQYLLLEIVKALVTFTNYYSERCVQQVRDLVKLFIARACRVHIELLFGHLQLLLHDVSLFVR
jgi:hypothetical protein